MGEFAPVRPVAPTSQVVPVHQRHGVERKHDAESQRQGHHHGQEPEDQVDLHTAEDGETPDPVELPKGLGPDGHIDIAA